MVGCLGWGQWQEVEVGVQAAEGMEEQWWGRGGERRRKLERGERLRRRGRAAAPGSHAELGSPKEARSAAQL